MFQCKCFVKPQHPASSTCQVPGGFESSREAQFRMSQAYGPRPRALAPGCLPNQKGRGNTGTRFRRGSGLWAPGSGPDAVSQEAAQGFSPRPEPEAGPPTPGVAISWSPGCRFLCTLPPRLPLPHLHSEATSCSEGWAKAVLKETGMWVESLGT